MKTKTIPFDLETAKKIQAGEIEGNIKTKEGSDVRIICWDKKGKCPIIALVDVCDKEVGYYYDSDGFYFSQEKEGGYLNLVLEVPDTEPQFKPFDRVLARENDASLWRTGFYSHELDGKHCVCGNYYQQCTPYDGNEHLLGTSDKSKK